MEKNYYLTNGNYKTTGDKYLDKMIGLNENTIIINNGLKDADAFAKASKFLANYGKSSKTTIPYEYGKVYELADGTPIIFFDDSIQIGFDLYYFKDFGCYAMWAYQIVGGILFHSNTVSDTHSKPHNGGLGHRASHGCIRMRVEDAKWIYDNCPQGTTVVVQE